MQVVASMSYVWPPDWLVKMSRTKTTIVEWSSTQPALLPTMAKWVRPPTLPAKEPLWVWPCPLHVTLPLRASAFAPLPPDCSTPLSSPHCLIKWERTSPRWYPSPKGWETQTSMLWWLRPSLKTRCSMERSFALTVPLGCSLNLILERLLCC